MTKPDYMRDLERSAPARLAAQVGDQHSPEWHIIQATIERCAQVADAMVSGARGEFEALLAAAIAANIRKLKDEA